MKTEHLGGTRSSIVELGANWIHGPTLSNSIFMLGSQLHLLHGAPLLDRSERQKTSSKSGKWKEFFCGLGMIIGQKP